MKKALTYAIFGGNIFFIFFISFGLYMGIGEALAEGHELLHGFIGKVFSGLLFFGRFIYFVPLIIPFMLIPFCISVLIKKRVSDKFAKINRVIFLSFISFYVILILTMMAFIG